MKSPRARKKVVTLVIAAVLLFIVVPVALAWPFGDVPAGYWAYNQIKRISNLSITAGCGGGNYCPERAITRAEMAVYVDNLTKAHTNDNEPYIFSVDNQNNGANKSGDGIEAKSYDGTGLVGESYGGAYAASGVYGWSNSTRQSDAGVKGASLTAATGVIGAAVERGVYGQALGTGVYAWAFGDGGEAVHGHGTGSHTEGVLGTATGANGRGVYGLASSSNVNAIGVRGQTNGTWGFWSEDSLYLGGSCTGCTMAFVARNADTSVLEVGDVVSVSGVASPLKGEQTPVLEVRRALSSSSAIGVVGDRAKVITTETPVLSDASGQREALQIPSSADEVIVPSVEFESEIIEVAGIAEGPVAPGDYLFIVVQGLTQVRADPKSGIQAGDRLMVGDGGKAASAVAEAPTIGRAVDSVDPNTGLVWVLVDLQ